MLLRIVFRPDDVVFRSDRMIIVELPPSNTYVHGCYLSTLDCEPDAIRASPSKHGVEVLVGSRGSVHLA